MAFRALRPLGASATGRGTFNVQEFRGLDKVSGEDNFSPYRAADLENFIRDKIGQVKKRGGFEAETGTAPEWREIWNGICFEYSAGDIRISKGDVYYDMKKLLPDASQVSEIQAAVGYSFSDAFCVLARTDTGFAVMKCTDYTLIQYAVFFEKKTVLGAKELAWGGEGAWIPSEGAEPNLLDDDFIPISTIVENATPVGNGQIMFSPNILTPFVRETFTVTEKDYDNPSDKPDRCARFQLSNRDICVLDGSAVIAANEWMADGTEQKTYWEKNYYGKLTAKGVEVLRNSVKVEVYKRRYNTAEQDVYAWVDVTELCFGDPSDPSGFLNTEAGALWIPRANIKASPEEGKPSVRITYMRNAKEQRKNLKELIGGNLCTRYGVSGYKDRAFIASQNRIYYSEAGDGLRINELNYVEPCPSDRTIVAMGGQGKYLYAVDSEGVSYAIGGAVAEDNTAAFARDASFVILDHVQGEKPVGNILDVFGDEFCYLSEMGLVAIRHDDFYDKRYAQNRSRMLGELLKGKRLCACRWGSFMVIGAEDRLYLLDEMQQSTLPDCKYSGKQYEAYVFTFDKAFLAASGVAVNDTVAPVDYESEESEPTQLPTYISKVWTEGDSLKVCAGGKIWTYDPEGKADLDAEGNKYPITAVWVTPKLSLSSFYRKKIIHRLALTLGGEMCSVRLEYRTDNREDWTVLREYDGRFYRFDYGAINYGFWTYRGEVSRLQLIINRRPSRKFNKIQFKFTNANEDGLSLAEFGMVYETEVL